VKAKPTKYSKPTLSTADVLSFAEARTAAATSTREATVTRKAKSQAEAAKASDKSRFPPEGDTRLTINIRVNLHRKLKHAAVDQGTTVGALLAELIEKHL